MSRLISESACAGSTLVKYSRFVAGPSTASERPANAPNAIASGTRVAGIQTASARHTGRPRCGSIIAPAAAIAAGRARPCHEKYAARQMHASASGTTSPSGSETTPSERAKTASALSHCMRANRASAKTHARNAAISSAAQSVAAALNGKSESGTTAAIA